MHVIKALVNENTLLPMMFPELRNLGNICCGHKMFLNKIRNIFCVPDTKFVSAQMLRAGANGETFVSSTMCPLLPGPKSTDYVARFFLIDKSRTCKRRDVW